MTTRVLMTLVDQLFDAGRSTMDPAKRRKIYSDLARAMVEDATWVFLMQLVDECRGRRGPGIFFPVGGPTGSAAGLCESLLRIGEVRLEL